MRLANEEQLLLAYLKGLTVDLRAARSRLREFELAASDPVVIVGMGAGFRVGGFAGGGRAGRPDEGADTDLDAMSADEPLGLLDEELVTPE